MKRQTAIIVFYTAYFIWLLIIAYICPETDITNLFAAVIVTFYFVYLKGEDDVKWFLGTVAVITAYLFFNETVYLEDFTYIDTLIYLPIWIPLIWGTTVLALRKFYLTMNKGLS